ncbi:MAG: hypothetical protein JXR64_02575 [Spirochaetales bacterium]|nr:hypothetical protein [Spirochaetales bacterium]
MEIKEEVKALPISVIGQRIVVYPIAVPEKQVSGIIVPKISIDRMDMEKSKQQELKAQDLFDRTTEHPYQGIIVGIGKEAKEYGLNLGDIVYTSYMMTLSRDAIKINNEVYIVMGMSSVYCVVGNIKLEEEKIKSFIL